MTRRHEDAGPAHTRARRPNLAFTLGEERRTTGNRKGLAQYTSSLGRSSGVYTPPHRQALNGHHLDLLRPLQAPLLVARPRPAVPRAQRSVTYRARHMVAGPSEGERLLRVARSLRGSETKGRPDVVRAGGSARPLGAARVMALCLPRLVIAADELGVGHADAHLRDGDSEGVSRPRSCAPLCAVSAAPSAAPPHRLHANQGRVQTSPPSRHPRCQSKTREERG